MKAVNLIPVEQREHASGFANRSQGVAYVFLGVLAGLALLVLLYGVARHQVGDKKSEATRLEQEAQQVQSQATSLTPYKTFVSIRESREKTVRELVDSRFDWAHMLSELGRVLPVGVSVGSMEGCVTEPSKTGGSETSCSSGAATSSAAASTGSATPSGSVPHFTITGCALSQSTVARTLTNLKLIDGAKEVELASATKTGTNSTGGGAGGANCPKGSVSYSVRLAFQPLPTPPPAPATPPAGVKSTPATTPAASSAHPASAAAHTSGKQRPVAARTSGGRAG